jgi:hypothetical protein
MENIGNQSFMHHQEKIIRLGRSRSPERLNFTGTAHFNGNANGIILNNDSKIILNNTNSNSNSNLKLNWKGTHTRTPSFRNSVQV